GRMPGKRLSRVGLAAAQRFAGPGNGVVQQVAAGAVEILDGSLAPGQAKWRFRIRYAAVDHDDGKSPIKGRLQLTLYTTVIDSLRRTYQYDPARLFPDPADRLALAYGCGPPARTGSARQCAYSPTRTRCRRARERRHAGRRGCKR